MQCGTLKFGKNSKNETPLFPSYSVYSLMNVILTTKFEVVIILIFHQSVLLIVRELLGSWYFLGINASIIQNDDIPTRFDIGVVDRSLIIQNHHPHTILLIFFFPFSYSLGVEEPVLTNLCPGSTVHEKYETEKVFILKLQYSGIEVCIAGNGHYLVL